MICVQYQKDPDDTDYNMDNLKRSEGSLYNIAASRMWDLRG